MQQQNRRIFIIAGITLSVVVLFIIGLISERSTSTKSGAGPTTTYNDPVSHQKIVTQQGKAPETNGVNTQSPIFAGFGVFVDDGLTIQQLNALEYAFANYRPFANNSTQISVAVDDINQVSPDNSGDAQDRWSFKSHIVVNKTDTYKFTFYYDGVSTVQLYLYDAGGTQQLFDSGVIDGNTITSQN